MKDLRLGLYLKKDKTNSMGETPVYVKINYLISTTTLDSGIKVDAERWKLTNQLTKTRILPEMKIRSSINIVLQQIEQTKEKLKLRGLPFSAKTIKDAYLNNDDSVLTCNLMLSELFDKHYNSFEPLIKSNIRAKDTLRKYRTLRNHVCDFLNIEYQIDDIPLNNLNYSFIESFDLFLRSNKNIGNNTTVKYVQSFRRLINLAIKYDWIEKDPFKLYDKKVIVKDAEFLTKEELEQIENLELPIKRLEIVRDIFVFGCYTGYAPVDIQKLTNDNIHIDKDGQKWIIIKRTKTGINADVPLLPKAEEIINKYSNSIDCIVDNRLLPKRSTQKMNLYLKEIAEMADLKINLHQYVARHTFACTIILENGLSMEVLSKMLGHTNLRQTQHYGKIQNSRVAEEMKILKIKLSK